MTYEVSFSKMRKWRRCHYLYHLTYVERLRRRRKARPLAFGDVAHKSIHAAIQGESWKAPIREFSKVLSAMFEEERIELKLDGADREVERVVRGYLRHYENDGLEYVGSEIELKVEIAPGIVLNGYVDAVVRVPGPTRDRPWILERKTCKRVPDEKQRASDTQTVLYWWALPMSDWGRREGVKPNDVAGVVWDYVRSKAPTVPQQLKSGELSRAQRIDTTREVYLAEIRRLRLDPKAYAEMLDSLRGREDNFFRRIKLPFSRQLRDQVKEETRQTAVAMSRLHGVLKDRNLTRDCSWCEFYSLCQARLRGVDTTYMLKHEYEVREERDEDEDDEEEADAGDQE